MKKIISLFCRNYDGDRCVRDEVVPGAEWVIAGEGTPTRKYDGTCCMIRLALRGWALTVSTRCGWLWLAGTWPHQRAWYACVGPLCVWLRGPRWPGDQR